MALKRQKWDESQQFHGFQFQWTPNSVVADHNPVNTTWEIIKVMENLVGNLSSFHPPPLLLLSYIYIGQHSVVHVDLRGGVPQLEVLVTWRPPHQMNECMAAEAQEKYFDGLKASLLELPWLNFAKYVRRFSSFSPSRFLVEFC